MSEKTVSEKITSLVNETMEMWLMSCNPRLPASVRARLKRSTVTVVGTRVFAMACVMAGGFLQDAGQTLSSVARNIFEVALAREQANEQRASVQ